MAEIPQRIAIGITSLCNGREQTPQLPNLASSLLALA
jgi:hypothetical protein